MRPPQRPSLAFDPELANKMGVAMGRIPQKLGQVVHETAG